MAEILSNISELISNYINGLTTIEIISIAGIIGTAFFYIVIERILPYNRGQKVFREGFFNDLALYTIAQSYILSIIIFGFLISWIDGATGLSRLKIFADVPLWAQLIFYLLTHDFLYILDASVAAQKQIPVASARSSPFTEKS